MINEKYNKIIKEVVPKENTFFNALTSFFIGGLIGIIGQIYLFLLSNLGFSYKESTSILIITFIFVASLLTGLGIFDELVKKFKCALIIPITGFSHAVTSSMIEYKHEGLVPGIGSNTFKLAGSVIVYGIVSSFFMGFIYYIVGVIC